MKETGEGMTGLYTNVEQDADAQTQLPSGTHSTDSARKSTRYLVSRLHDPWFVATRAPSFDRRIQTNAQVFAGVYPVDSNDFPKLEESIKRVCIRLAVRLCHES